MKAPANPPVSVEPIAINADVKIEALHLSVRARNAILYNDYRTLGDLLARPGDELMRQLLLTPNCGRTAWMEIDRMLNELSANWLEDS